MIRAKCDLRKMCFDKIRGRFRVTAGYSRWIEKSSAEAEEEKSRSSRLIPENSDTSVCKTNSMEDQWILMYKYKGHGVVFGMLYAEKATVNETD